MVRIVVCTLILALCSAAAISALSTGKVIAHMQRISRAEYPALFWIMVSVYAVVAAFALRGLLWG
jgi:hypothetical protein